MKILRARHLGMCFGVRDAITLASLEARRQPLTILGELVHNESVLDSLRNQGIALESELRKVTTPTVMITAHGASQSQLDRVRARGLNVIEATCPLVHFAHRQIAQLVADGCHPVIIGKRDHVEVRGLTGDLKAFDVVLSEADVEALTERPRFGVAAQTTQPIDKVHRLLALIRRRFPGSEVRFADTVCRPTKERQAAAIDLARQSDVVVVIGGANSNNTRELVVTCARHCSRVHHVQAPADLCPDWFAGAETVGMTAGTSTPNALLDLVEARIRELAHGFGAPPVGESAGLHLSTA